jgi:hypothetical protein
MSDLLEEAVVARGGMDQWNSVTSIDVAASITGTTWFVKAEAMRSRTSASRSTPTRAADDGLRGSRQAFDLRVLPRRAAAGRRHAHRVGKGPREVVDGHVFATPWDDLHLAEAL